MRKSKEYLNIGETISLCEICLELVPAKIILKDNQVYYHKYCTTHGNQETLISTDYNYFQLCKNTISKSYLPSNVKLKADKKCPYDCGLCEEHEQHTAMGIVEILDECNMRCPTCIAASFPGAGKVKSLSQIEKMFDTLVEYEGTPDILMISGGEPTIHQNIYEILDCAKTKPFKHIFLISNGVRIANDIEFVDNLKKHKNNFEVYLQFDSLNSNVLEEIRGEDLVDVRLKSLENLEKAGIHSTLICVVKKGVNEKEMSEVINFALNYKYVRGVTFQPCKITGRNDNFDKSINYITLSEVRQSIIDTSSYFSTHDLIPHPLNPENISIGYLLKTEQTIKPVTSYLFRDSHNSKKYKVEFPHSDELKSMMYFLPELDCEDVKYEDLFRVTIVSFLDKYNFCTSAVKKSCIHFVTMKGELIPIDTYYLLYGDG
jgi:7,8-dihydro-6-hydroxymethylpterin dimethyltransferase